MKKLVVLILALIVVLTLIIMSQRGGEPESPTPPAPRSAAPGVAGEPSSSVTTPLPTVGIDPSLAREAQAAVQRASQWLLAQQAEEGYWSSPEFPALTGLALWALVQANTSNQPAIDRAVKYLLTCVHPDGSIYVEPSEERKGGGLPTYNTALAMVALHAVGDAALNPVVQKARAFLAQSQHFGSDVYDGGMGYDPDTGRAYADLSNSFIAYEAMRLTERIEDLRAGEEHTDLDWDAAIRFIERVQNRPESNPQPWASDEEQEHGGFAYRPDSSQAGAYTDEEGVERLRSYGSMTYAGLLSFIYARVDREDPRIQSAFEWTQKFWSLDENPGMGQQGLFYYYHTLAKALAVYGADTVTLTDGRRLDWRNELTRKLLSIQKIEAATGHGYWVNDEGRWWEADPVLVTSYTLIALTTAVSGASPSL